MNTILKLGHRSLITVTNKVSFPLTSEDKEDIETLIKTLNDRLNSEGIAANQIGINKQIIAYRLPKNITIDEYNPNPFFEPQILINPEIDLLSEEKEYGLEGCLSIPGMYAVVPRYSNVHISGYDINGILLEETTTGFLSRNLQHEIDHLNGLTIFHRIEDHSLISFKSEKYISYNVRQDSLGKSS